MLKKLTLIMGMFAIMMISACEQPQKTEGEKPVETKSPVAATRERSDVDDKYKWNLADFYESTEAWQADYDAVAAKIKEFPKLQGTLSKSPASLIKAYEALFALEKDAYLVYFYASSNFDLDMTNNDASILKSKADKLIADFGAAASWFTPELMEIPDAKIKKFLQSEELAGYKHLIESTLRTKKHTLDAKSEELLAKLSPISRTASDVYSVLNNAELPFPTIKAPDGSEIKVSHALYGQALYGNDRKFAKEVYEGVYVPYKELKNTFASIYNANVNKRIINANVRGFDGALEAALFSNNIPVDVYKNLIKTAHDNIAVLHRWAQIKKKVLGYNELHPYDSYTSLFASQNKTYTYDEGVEMCLEAFKPLGEEYCNAVKHSIENRWIDVYETPGKRAGAYSNSCMSVHPLILLNWSGTLNDVFTLAHEIGHNMHSYFSEKNQPFHYGDYPIFVAEVASITNEALLQHYLIEKAETKEEKMYLIEKFLVSAQSTFFRQTRFAEFEMLVHEKAQNGEILSADGLTELFHELYSQYWGDAMTVDATEGYSWARVHHLTKYNFYVYQYATGFAAAQALSELMISEGQPAVDRYLNNFIEKGDSDYAINILKAAGVDMSTPLAVEKTCEKISRYLDELEALMAE
jgi:oligoendopeptidase F